MATGTKRKAVEEVRLLGTPKRQRGIDASPVSGRSARAMRRAASQSPDNLLSPQPKRLAAVLIRSPQANALVDGEGRQEPRESSDDELAAKQEVPPGSASLMTPTKANVGQRTPSKAPTSAPGAGLRAARASSRVNSTPRTSRVASPAALAGVRPSTQITPSKAGVSQTTPSKSASKKKMVVKATPGKSTPSKGTPSKAKKLKATPTKEAAIQDEEGSQDEMEDVEETTKDQVITDGPEVYFQKMASKDRTSNNTLEQLPILTQAECAELLKNAKPSYAASARNLIDAHVACFPEWALEMSMNHTVCLHGYGSKKQLLDQFIAKHFASWFPCVTIQGYHPATDLRRVCFTMNQALEKTGTDVASVLRALDESKEPLVVLVHNIDGENLRNERSQSALVRLLEHPRVWCIASIDHVKAPLLWDTRKTHALNLLYHDATTFLPYTAETALQASIFDAKASKQRLMGDRGISWILQTLSQNAKTIFRLLLEEQIGNGGTAGVEGTRLYELASRAFAVSSQSAFQAQLGEFLDHEIIVASKEVGLGDVFRVPFEGEELTRLLQSLEE